MINRFFGTVLLLTCLFSGTAQVQVSKEPRHHNVFENSWVRVLDVHITPGDTSLMHKHSTPSVFIILNNAKTGSQVMVEPAKLQLTDGNIWFEGFYDKPRIHRIWNVDTVELHVIDMELPNKKNKAIDPPLDIPSFILFLEEKPVRGYRFTLAAQSTIQLPPRKAPIMVVALTNTVGHVTANNKIFIKKGDFVFIKPDTSIVFNNQGSASQPFAVFELK